MPKILPFQRQKFYCPLIFMQIHGEMNIRRPLSFVASSALPSAQMSTTHSNSSGNGHQQDPLEEEFSCQQSISWSTMMDMGQQPQHHPNNNNASLKFESVIERGITHYYPITKRGWLFHFLQVRMHSKNCTSSWVPVYIILLCTITVILSLPEIILILGSS